MHWDKRFLAPNIGYDFFFVDREIVSLDIDFKMEISIDMEYIGDFESFFELGSEKSWYTEKKYSLS